MWSKVGIGGEHHRYYKHTKFCQNPRGDPKFLVDLTRNDPYGSFHAQSTKNCKDPPQILTKLGVFGVPMVLITHVDF